MAQGSNSAGADDSSVRVALSPNINYAVVIGLIGSMLAGTWWMASQSSSQAILMSAMSQKIADNKVELAQRMKDGDDAMNDRMTRFVQTFTTRIDNMDKNNEQRSAAVSALDARMARIESKLDCLISKACQARGQ